MLGDLFREKQRSALKERRKLPLEQEKPVIREGATVSGLEFHFGEGEEPVKAKKMR